PCTTVLRSGVALVAHGARPLLTLPEWLLGFEDLGALEPSHLECDLLQRSRGNRQRRTELGMAVALHDLRRHRCGLEPELAAHLLFDLGIDLRKVSDRARELADGHHVAGSA